MKLIFLWRCIEKKPNGVLPFPLVIIKSVWLVSSIIKYQTKHGNAWRQTELKSIALAIVHANKQYSQCQKAYNPQENTEEEGHRDNCANLEAVSLKPCPLVLFIFSPKI